MAIKIQWDAEGPFAICDTAGEALELLRQARSSSNGSDRPKQEQLAAQPMEERISRIIAGINDKARRLLKALLNYPQGIDGVAFGKVCGMEPAGFGGVLGGISKEAKKVSLTVDKLMRSEARFEGLRRYRWLAPTKFLLEHKDKLNLP